MQVSWVKEGRSKRRGGEKKVQLNVRISKRLCDEVRRLAFAKYGRMHGALSWELEQALRAWVAAHTHGAHTPAAVNATNPPPRVAKAWEKVRSYLRARFGYVGLGAGAQVLRSHLAEAIAAAVGSDPRTVRKYFKYFQDFKVIKWIGGEVFEVV
jgi:hypothetical protein